MRRLRVRQGGGGCRRVDPDDDRPYDILADVAALPTVKLDVRVDARNRVPPNTADGAPGYGDFPPPPSPSTTLADGVGKMLTASSSSAMFGEKGGVPRPRPPNKPFDYKAPGSPAGAVVRLDAVDQRRVRRGGHVADDPNDVPRSPRSPARSPRSPGYRSPGSSGEAENVYASASETSLQQEVLSRVDPSDSHLLAKMFGGAFAAGRGSGSSRSASPRASIATRRVSSVASSAASVADGRSTAGSFVSEQGDFTLGPPPPAMATAASPLGGDSAPVHPGAAPSSVYAQTRERMAEVAAALATMPPPRLRTNAHGATLAGLLSPFVPLFSRLGERTAVEVAKELVVTRAVPRERLCVEGEPGGSMYVVLSGTLTAYATGAEFPLPTGHRRRRSSEDVLLGGGGKQVTFDVANVDDPTKGHGDGSGARSFKLGVGSSVGALNVLAGDGSGPATWRNTVVVDNDQTKNMGAGEIAELAELTREAYALAVRRAAIASTLLAIPAMKRMSSAMINRVMDSMRYETVAPGQVVFRQGTKGTKFYIVVTGSVIVTAKAASGDANFASESAPGKEKTPGVARKTSGAARASTAEAAAHGGAEGGDVGETDDTSGAIRKVAAADSAAAAAATAAVDARARAKEAVAAAKAAREAAAAEAAAKTAEAEAGEGNAPGGATRKEHEVDKDKDAALVSSPTPAEVAAAAAEAEAAAASAAASAATDAEVAAVAEAKATRRRVKHQRQDSLRRGSLVNDARALFVDLDVAKAGANVVETGEMTAEAMPADALEEQAEEQVDLAEAALAEVGSRDLTPAWPAYDRSSGGVKLDEIVLRHLGAGDSFGELALLRNEKRSATVRATARTELLSLDKMSYLRLMEAAVRAIELTREASADGTGVDGFAALRGPEGMRAVLSKQAGERARDDMESLATFFSKLPFFARMPWQVRVDLCHSLQLDQCERDKIVFLEGDAGDRMYIILSGRVRVTRAVAGGGIKTLKMLGPGEQFGELALLKNGAQGTRAATVTAVEDCDFATLDRKSYARTMRAEDISRIQNVTGFLSRCAMFRSWSKAALTRLALYCSPVEPQRGETLVRAGERAQFVYILQEGECSVVFSSKTEEQEEREAEEAKAAEVAAELSKINSELTGKANKDGKGAKAKAAKGKSRREDRSKDEDKASSSPAGGGQHQHHVAVLGPDDSFGELSVLADEPMSYSVVCAGHDPVRLLRISAMEFKQRMSSSSVPGAEREVIDVARVREATYAERARRAMMAHDAMFLDDVGLAALEERRRKKTAAADAEAAKRNTEKPVMPPFPGAVGGTMAAKVETIPQEWELARRRAAALQETTREAGTLQIETVRRLAIVHEGGKGEGASAASIGDGTTSVVRVSHRPTLPRIGPFSRVASREVPRVAEGRKAEGNALSLPDVRAASGGGEGGGDGDEGGSLSGTTVRLETWRSAPVTALIEKGMAASRARERNTRLKAEVSGSSRLTPRQRAAAASAKAEAEAAARRDAAAAKRKALGPSGDAEVSEYEPSDSSFIVPTHTSRAGFGDGYYESGWMFF